jgi:hypothetical protein
LVQRKAAQRKADWYRAQAAECATAAKIAVDPQIKAFNEAEAQRWLRLAEAVEKQDPGDQPQS